MIMIGIALISDVHIDKSWLNPVGLINGARTVIVAGDISNHHEDTMKWLRQLKNEVDEVIWVPGNHDFYRSPGKENDKRYPYTVDDINEYFQKTSEENGIVYLNRKSVVIDGITYVGATGWHDFIAGEPYSHEDQIAAWARIDEAHVINWSYENRDPSLKSLNVLLEAYTDRNFIGDAVVAAEGPVIVVTHHLPHRSLTTQMPHMPMWTKLHGMFVNTGMETIHSDKIKYWCYGHTHFRNMVDINETTYVCNPRGTPGQNLSWTPVVLDV